MCSQLVIHFFVGHFDVFCRRDAVDDQFRLHVILGALFLPLSQCYPVQIYRARINSLRRQRTHDALQPHIHLMFHERFRYREVMQLHDLRQNFFVQQFLVFMVALVLQPFADFFLQFVQRRRVAYILREIIIQLCQLLSS